MTTTQAPTAPIDYGRATPRRRRLLRRVVVIIIVLTAVMIVRWTAPPIWNQFEVRRQQSKMLNFTPPAPETIAFSSDSAECDRLLVARGTHGAVDVHYVGTGTPYPMKIAGFTPILADPLFTPGEWGMAEPSRSAKYPYGPVALLPLGPSPTLFMHWRRAVSGGERRLVHVSAVLYHDDMPLADARSYVGGEWARYEKQHRDGGNTDVYFIRLSLTPRVFSTASWRPGSRWTRLKSATSAPANNGEIPMPCRVHASMVDGLKLEPLVLRIHVGIADPADESRFTLDYDVDGVAGVIEGKLNADDSITWTILSGPLKQWPPRDGFWGLNP